MNWTIEFGGDPAEVTIETFGVASREGFIRLNIELVSDPRWRPGMAVLVDHTALDSSLLTGTDIDAISSPLSGSNTGSDRPPARLWRPTRSCAG
ncbi:MAG: hypothetical protein ACXVRI_10255 [Gaiellaceae bacterium]